MSFQTRKEWNWIMTGIIITGYGKFAEGLKDALEAVTGPAENIETVSFSQNDTEELFNTRLQDAINHLKGCSSILFLCDMTGGIPYRLATQNAEQMESEVLAGINLGMLVESSISRQFTLDVHALAEQVLNIGRDQVERFAMNS
ncbi:PTS sugar transporter subunit IIA [Ileibacterium valens]|nr:PTS sugar transporter subunit IIA [Ileibacterium valens]